jgi:hypothetical protein
MEALQELHAVDAGKPDIQQDQRRLHGVEALPEALCVRKCDGLISLVLENALYCGRDGRFVVYYADRVHIRLFPMFVPY